MDNQLLTIHSRPRAILHLDADAFFASCEQAVHPELRGKPVIAGRERGIVAAASYEAKGVKTGMSLLDVKKVCPEAILVPAMSRKGQQTCSKAKTKDRNWDCLC